MTSVEDTSKKEKAQHPFRQSDATFVNHPEQRCPKELAKKRTRPNSEPIKFKRERSRSEVELHENEMAAEYRDSSMYLRVMSGKLRNSTTKSSPADQIITRVTQLRHSYNTTPDDSFHDLDTKEHFATTPILRNAPIGITNTVLCNAPTGIDELAGPLFSSRKPVDTRFSGHYFSLVDATRRAEVMDDDGSVDQIFELEL